MRADAEPLVSVIMPVFNGEAYLQEAVESILTQTHRNLEFIIIDDKSADQGLSLIKKYPDKRIQVIENSLNMGISHSLNRGLDAATGKYIARMDCDDIALPQRLERQVAYLEKNHGIDILGSAIRAFGDKEGVWSCQTDHEAIRAQLLFDCPIYHPTVMLRASAINKHGLRYPCGAEDYRVEDYAFWIKSTRLLKSANLSEALLHYRTHRREADALRKKNVDNLRRGLLNELGVSFDEDDFLCHLSVSSHGQYIPELGYIKSVSSWFHRILQANANSGVYAQHALAALLEKKLWNVFLYVNRQKKGAWPVYRATGFALPGDAGVRKKLFNRLISYRRREQMGSKSSN